MRTRLLVALLAAVGLLPPVAAQVPEGVALEPVVSIPGDPVAVRHAGDGSGRLFVVDRIGQIRVVSAAGSLLPTPFVDFASSAPPHGFVTWGENGLLGLAFHPDFASNRQVFLHYTGANRDNIVERYLVSTSDPNRIDRNTAQTILRIGGDSAYHRGGDLHFGRDGFLYLSTGDGGAGFVDTCKRGQTLGPADLAANDGNHADCAAKPGFVGSGGNPDSRALQAKILRIDIDNTTPAGSNNLCGSASSGAANYAIPAGNPFASDGSRCAETWSYGLRNPYRFSVDRQTGDLFIGDVGEGQMEEIDFQAAGVGGLNFGWSSCEGTMPMPPGNCAGFVPPILTHTHGTGVCSVIGGYRYRGQNPALTGLYIYTDFCFGRIFLARQQGASWPAPSAWQPPQSRQFTGMGEDESGELYFTAFKPGQVLKLRATNTVPDRIFANGFEQ